MDELEQLVKAGQQGDKPAFGQIVERFQDMAYAVAYAMLGDEHLSQDAAQEAFIDAYMSLPQLRKPAAFPGWFRRIVVKHSDRILRSQRMLLVPLDHEYERLPTMPDDPALIFEKDEFEQQIHCAIATLPDRYRLVTRLFYVKGYSQHDIAGLLELPLSTVKKRLYDARRQLRERMTEMENDYLNHRPSQDTEFAQKVNFFIGLKTGDNAQVAALITENPSLINLPIEWGVASEGYYWPIGASPLHFAAGTGNEDLMELLLEAGALINATSRSGMTPLHFATLMQQLGAIRLLLARGADVNAETTAGLIPLHHAVMRNNTVIAGMLLQRGANLHARDKKGRTPVDWAQAKNLSDMLDLLVMHGAPVSVKSAQEQGETEGKNDRRLVAVGAELGGQVLDGWGHFASESDFDEIKTQPIFHPASSTASPVMETGIKILDLMAPFKRGGHHGVFTPIPGVGRMVLLAQLIANFTQVHGGYAVCMGLEEGEYTAESLMLEWRELGIHGRTVHVFEPSNNSDISPLKVTETGLTIAENFRASGHEVLLLVDTSLALQEGVLPYLRNSIAFAPSSAITTVYYGKHSIGAEPTLLADLDAALAFELTRAKQGLWPAIDPLRSYSTLLQSSLLNAGHRQIVSEAKRLLQRYQDLLPIVENQGVEGLENEDDRTVARRARYLNSYLAQPFSTAEPWTGLLGEYSPLPDTLSRLEAILAGQHDDDEHQGAIRIG